jgi:dephospho-CoA kinase
LNRDALRAIVFASASKRTALEQILHPRIRRQWSAQAQTHRNSSKFFFADIPLLYETGGETLCDRVVVVATAPGIQLARLLQRGHRDPAEAEKIIAAQMPLSAKMARADHVVWNDGGRELLAQQATLLVDLWRAETWTNR